MAKKYEVTPAVKLINKMMEFFVRWGWGPKQTYLLTVPGRKSGKLYTTPVSLVEEEGQRWLVAPYGTVGWVRNAKAAGEVTLSKGGKSETLSITEMGPQESGPILKKYLAIETFPRPYFEAQFDAPVDDFIAEADRHPVFRLG